MVLSPLPYITTRPLVPHLKIHSLFYVLTVKLKKGTFPVKLLPACAALYIISADLLTAWTKLTKDAGFVYESFQNEMNRVIWNF